MGSVLAGWGGWQWFKREAETGLDFPITRRGATHSVGHLLREALQRKPSRTEQTKVAIVGGGIAGLSAAWRLDRAGMYDYTLLELEPHLGGNSASGKNKLSEYPWGAHYVPVPGKEATWVHTLFEELGVITGWENGGPVYNEYYLCHDPDERLLINGRWQEGLVPHRGVPATEVAQQKKFFAEVERLRWARGAGGKPAFAIPLALSSNDPAYTKLDTISADVYLKGMDIDSEYLLWYLDYCCRDDFGLALGKTSAWAMLHYFAARRPWGANVESDSVLTWPAGNGWLVQQLSARLKGELMTNTLVTKIVNEGNGCRLQYYDVLRKEVVEVVADYIIYAAPQFSVPYVLPALRDVVKKRLPHFTYQPWLVANITLEGYPVGYGELLAWDNVRYKSPGLGYVVATQQRLEQHLAGTVITYYHALAAGTAHEERKLALERSNAEWAEMVVTELEHMHPGISKAIRSLDLWIWGHGMVGPQPGFIWGSTTERARQAAAKPYGRIHFAHSDLSGISIFEEAQWQGIRAAEEVLSMHKV